MGSTGGTPDGAANAPSLIGGGAAGILARLTARASAWSARNVTRSVDLIVRKECEVKQTAA